MRLEWSGLADRSSKYSTVVWLAIFLLTRIDTVYKSVVTSYQLCAVKRIRWHNKCMFGGLHAFRPVISISSPRFDRRGGLGGVVDWIKYRTRCIFMLRGIWVWIP